MDRSKTYYKGKLPKRLELKVNYCMPYEYTCVKDVILIKQNVPTYSGSKLAYYTPEYLELSRDDALKIGKDLIKLATDGDF